MKDSTFVTSNEHKLKWLKRFMGHEVASSDIDLDEIQELGYQRIVKLKKF